MLAKVFTDTVKQKGVRIVAETHSKELFYEVFNEIRGGRLSVDDVAAYDVKREGGKSVFTRIVLEMDNGHLEVDHPWGKGLDKA
jgi:hypothetical protein